jgi:hypothetical protein
MDIKNIFILVIGLFAVGATAQACNGNSCPISNCNFNKGVIRFGKTDGTLVTNGPFKIRVRDRNMDCVNKGNWQRPGNSSLGKPYRSPCVKKKDRGDRFPDIWLSDFSVTVGNKISYKWHVNEEWKLQNYKQPSGILVNDYLKCSHYDSSMIIVEDINGNSLMKVGVPLEFSLVGGDLSTNETLFVIIVMFLFLLLLLVACANSSGDHSDFVLGYALGGGFSSGGSGGGGGFGGFSDD